MQSRREIVIDATAQIMIQIAGVLIAVGIARWLTKPDIVRGLKMRTALSVKTLADHQVNHWQTIATNAANAYQKARV